MVIPTNGNDRGSIVLKAGQKVMVLKSPKGIYMQLESGKIIAIRTSANNKPNSPALPSQPFVPQQSNQPTTMAFNRPQSQPQPQPQPLPLPQTLDNSFNSGSKNGLLYYFCFIYVNVYHFINQ